MYNLVYSLLYNFIYNLLVMIIDIYYLLYELFIVIFIILSSHYMVTLLLYSNTHINIKLIFTKLINYCLSY
jgi:hypothetical protein